ncbi:hypothetical protein D3C80_1021220 [compost metagenome]
MQAFARLVGGHGDQVVQLQHAAGAGLEGLAVGAVHGAEAEVFQRLLGRVAGQIGGAEDLFEMLGLTLVDDVEDQVGVDGFAAVEDRGQVGRAVHGRAFRRHHQQGRRAGGLDDRAVGQLLLAGLAGLGDVDHLGAVIFDQQAGFLQVRQHFRHQGIGVGFAVPQVEGDVQSAELALQRGAADGDEVGPQGAVAGTAALQFSGGLAGAVAEGGVFLGLGGGLGIEALQVFQRDRAFSGEGTVAVGHEGQGQTFVAAGGDEQAHLEAPVAEVGVAPDDVAAEAEQPLQALADDGGAQVADVHRLGHVGTGVVDDDLARRRVQRGAGQGFVSGHLGGALGQGGVGELEVDEAGAGDFDRGQARVVAEALGHLGGQLARIGLQRLGGGQGAVGLEVGQVGAVRSDDAGKRGVHAFGGEGGGDRFAERGLEISHVLRGSVGSGRR